MNAGRAAMEEKDTPVETEAESETYAAVLTRAREVDAPLNLRLAMIADVISRVDPEITEIVEELITRLRGNGAGLSAPKPGDLMPDFLLPDETGRLTSLADVLTDGPAAISFNRGHWCPYCELDIRALAMATPRATEVGAKIVAITPETRRWNADARTLWQAPFHVLSDIDSSYALELDLLFFIGERKREAFMARGLDLATWQGNEAWMLPIPATFVVRRDGRIAERFVDPDFRRRMEIEDLLAALAEAG